MTDLYLLGALYLLSLAACLWWAWRWRHQHAATMRDFARDCFPPEQQQWDAEWYQDKEWTQQGPVVDLEAYRRAQLDALVLAGDRRPQSMRRVW